MKTRTATLILGLLASGLATADDKAPPLPWLVSGGHHYIVGVV
jgi:hypothetical protein